MILLSIGLPDATLNLYYNSATDSNLLGTVARLQKAMTGNTDICVVAADGVQGGYKSEDIRGYTISDITYPAYVDGMISRQLQEDRMERLYDEAIKKDRAK
jgi:hypothetical protein